MKQKIVDAVKKFIAGGKKLFTLITGGTWKGTKFVVVGTFNTIKNIIVGFYKFLKAFFYSGGKPQPVYFWVTIMLILIIRMLYLREQGRGNFSDTLILGMFGLVNGLLVIYNWYKKGSDSTGDPTTPTAPNGTSP